MKHIADDDLKEQFYALFLSILLQQPAEESFRMLGDEKTRRKWNKTVTQQEIEIVRTIKEKNPKLSYSKIIKALGIEGISADAMRLRVERSKVRAVNE